MEHVTKEKKFEKNVLIKPLEMKKYNNWISRGNEIIYYMIRPTEKRIQAMDYNAEEICQNVEKRDKKIENTKQMLKKQIGGGGAKTVEE